MMVVVEEEVVGQKAELEEEEDTQENHTDKPDEVEAKRIEGSEVELGIQREALVVPRPPLPVGELVVEDQREEVGPFWARRTSSNF